MRRGFCPRKVAVRVKCFNSKPRLPGWGFEVPDVEMSVPSVSGYLTMLMMERKDWPSGCQNNPMPGVGEGVLPGAVLLAF